jgi:hypothetical protein
MNIEDVSGQKGCFYKNALTRAFMRRQREERQKMRIIKICDNYNIYYKGTK